MRVFGNSYLKTWWERL